MGTLPLGLSMRLHGMVEKGWGSELIWVTNDKYCSKLMTFNAGAKFSMHFHAAKEETWLIQSGVFQVVTINTIDASRKKKILTAGDTWHNPPLVPHQLICLCAGVVLEVSTADSVEDNYRVEKGNSQCVF